MPDNIVFARGAHGLGGRPVFLVVAQALGGREHEWATLHQVAGSGPVGTVPQMEGDVGTTWTLAADEVVYLRYQFRS